MRILKIVFISLLILYTWHNSGNLNIDFAYNNYDEMASHQDHQDALAHHCLWDSDDSVYEHFALLNLFYQTFLDNINLYSENLPCGSFGSIWQPPKT